MAIKFSRIFQPTRLYRPLPPSPAWPFIRHLRVAQFEYAKFYTDVHFFYLRPFFASFFQKSIWYFAVAWLISQYFSCRDLKPVSSLFLLNVQVEVYQNILKLRCWLLAVSLWRAFFIKHRSRTSLPVSFLHDFWKKEMFLTLYAINWANLIVWLPLLIKLITLAFLSYHFPTLSKSRDSNLNS